MKAAPYRSTLCVFLCACACSAAAGPLDGPPGASLIHASRQHLNTTLAQPMLQPQPQPQSQSRGNRGGPKYIIRPSGSGLNYPPPANSYPPFSRPTSTNPNVAPTGGNPTTASNFPVSSPRPPLTSVDPTAPLPAQRGRRNQAPNPATPDTGITTALAFRDFLYGIPGENIICQSVAAMFAVTLGADGCAEEVANASKTVALQVIVTDGGEKIYELMVKGNSAEMVMSEASWVERHRFYVTFGFDGRLAPYITVFDFEPMFRTTAGLYPEREQQYEFIRRDRDSALREFQERIKSTISSALEVAFKRQVGAR
jgi:hypothetical protein